VEILYVCIQIMNAMLIND